MPAFAPRSVTFHGQLEVSSRIDDVFPLFSPEGERLWVPGWAPELLHPPGAVWEQGQIFRTREEAGEAIWIVTRLDRPRHEAEYHRVEPERYVARVHVRCQALAERRSGVSISYAYVGLSERGNQEIAAMTPAAFAERMAKWSTWIADLPAMRPAGRSDRT